jgi:hypothetical protein
VTTRPQISQNSPRRLPVLPVLMGLDTFALGGLTALLVVDRVLQETRNVYAPHDTDAASTVLDLMDDLLAYLFPCAGLLLFLVLTTIAVGVSQQTKVQTVRYSVTALMLGVVLLSATGIGVWRLRATQTPPVPSVTPTLTPAEGAFWGPQATECLVPSERLLSTVVCTHHIRSSG